MPLTTTRTFRVRHYECDAYGHLNNANYLRYMQEAAFDASAAAGYDVQRYDEIQRQWFIRSSEIEYLSPLGYNDEVAVTTWVADFSRVTSRRLYEFHRPGTGELAARGWSDWVFIDTSTGQPIAITPELREAFFPEGLPASFPHREPFSPAPPPPPGAFVTRRRVAWRDLDTAKHVNNAVYLEYIEECGMEAIAAHHWPWERMASAGFAIFIRKHQIEYRGQARYGEALELATWASAVRRSTATRHYTITRQSDGALLCRVNSQGVWVSLETGRPIRIPPELIADFAPNLSTE